MSFSKPPVVASSVALLAALSLAPSQGWAKDGRGRGNADVIYEMAPMTSDSSHDIIFELPPMKPAKSATAQAPKPKPVQQPEPAVAAKPAPAPAPVREAAPAQPPAPVQTAAPIAEAPKPADAQPVAEVQPPVPAQAPAAAAEPVPSPVAEQVPGQSTPAPLEGQGVAQDMPPAPPPVAEAQIVEPAPIGPPIMTLNPARKAVTALKAPVAPMDDGILVVEDAPAALFVPKLISLAPEAAPAPVAQAAGDAPAQEQAPAAAPADPAAAQAEADARISALLAEGLVGPAEIRLADRATMWLPAGRVFLPLETARKLAKEAGLEWRAGVQGMVAPAGGKLEWLAPVELLDDGYIKVDGPESLQPEKLLAAFQASLPEVNAQRARVDQPPVTLEGWLTPPALNDKHRLAGCVNISTQNDRNGMDRFFNCEAWALGRQGAIKVGLADGGEGAARLKDEAAALADTIVFDRGKTYDEFDPAADKVAPYAAGDLLTRDVTSKTAPPVPAAEEEGGSSLSGMMSSLLYPALFGVAILGAYVFVKRRREAGKEDEPQTEAAPAPMRIEKASALEPRRMREAPAPAMQEPAPEAAPSLFARMLPTLYARFAKKTEPAPALAPEVVDVESFSPVPKVEAAASPVGGLMGKIAALRSKDKVAEKPASAPAAAKAANDAEEPASALKKLAAKMRRTAEEPPPAPVNMSRVMRSVRPSGGAAPAILETAPEPLVVEAEQPAAREQNATAPELMEPNAARPMAPEPKSEPPVFAARETGDVAGAVSPERAPGPQSMFDEDDFGLVEPGDPKPVQNRRANDR